MPTVAEALKTGRDIDICHPCAKAHGGVWPRGHEATFGPSRCGVCEEDNVSCCALSDWNWPGKGARKMDREF